MSYKRVNKTKTPTKKKKATTQQTISKSKKFSYKEFLESIKTLEHRANKYDNEFGQMLYPSSSTKPDLGQYAYVLMVSPSSSYRFTLRSDGSLIEEYVSLFYKEPSWSTYHNTKTFDSFQDAANYVDATLYEIRSRNKI